MGSIFAQLDEYAKGRGRPTPQLAQGLARARYESDPGNQIVQDRYALYAGIEASGIEAANIGDEENRRFAEQSHFLGDEFDKANAPTLTQATIDRMYGKIADQAGDDAGQALSNLREASGQGLGETAGLGAQIELQRLGQLSGARSDLTVLKASADRQDRVDRYGRALGLAGYRGQSPSTFFSDYLSSLTDTNLALLGIETNRQAGRDASNAAKQAGRISAATGIVGAAGLAL